MECQQAPYQRYTIPCRHRTSSSLYCRCCDQGCWPPLHILVMLSLAQTVTFTLHRAALEPCTSPATVIKQVRHGHDLCCKACTMHEHTSMQCGCDCTCLCNGSACCCKALAFKYNNLTKLETCLRSFEDQATDNNAHLNDAVIPRSMLLMLIA